MTDSVWVSIVNYRTPDLLIACLSSISNQRQALRGGYVVVVDNCSDDDSSDKYINYAHHSGADDWVVFKTLNCNGGFAFGNNAAIEVSNQQFQYLILLNPDTTVKQNALSALIDFMDANPKVGIAGSRLENSQGSIESSAHTFPTPLGELEAGARFGLLTRLLSRYAVTSSVRNEPHKCDWVSGASMIVRRQVFEDIGLLDEGYFLYFEEVDFCRRAKNAGWECWHVPESQVVHLEGASTGITQTAKRRPAYWYNSRRRYFVKHHGVGGLILADLLWSLGRISYLMRRFLRLGAQGANRDPKWFMFDLLWGDCRALFTQEFWNIPRERVRT